MAPPVKICAWDPELGRKTIFTLAGEHGPYWLYESEESGYHLLIPKGEVWKFTDMSECKGLQV